jgi:polysaccharide export outer membrane protein
MKSNCRASIESGLLSFGHNFMNHWTHGWRIVLSAVLTGGLAIGCATAPAHSDAPPAAGPVQTSLRTGDQITVRIDTGNTGLQSVDAVIDENGEISLPLVNQIKATGLTPSGLAERIKANYVPRFYVHCTVTVLATVRFFYIGGEVRSPGRVNWTEDMTLMKAINTSGGFTDFASLRKVEIIRAKNKLIYNAEDIRQHPEHDVPIQPGDSVYVPRSIF